MEKQMTIRPIGLASVTGIGFLGCATGSILKERDPSEGILWMSLGRPSVTAHYQ